MARTTSGRGHVLQSVIATANARLDGALPLDHPGVVASFSDVDDLLGAMLLRWHTRLAANVEQALFREPLDLEEAVVWAWQTTQGQLPGVRLILDNPEVRALSPRIEGMIASTARKDWALMAVLAGRASRQDESALQVGRRIEQRARASGVISGLRADGRRCTS